MTPLTDKEKIELLASSVTFAVPKSVPTVADKAPRYFIISMCGSTIHLNSSHYFATEQDAINGANKLAVLSPDKSFYVCKVIGCSRSTINPAEYIPNA